VASTEFAHNRTNEGFGVAEEHERFVQVVERVFDSGEACGHAALDDHDGAGFVHIQNGHAKDRAAVVGAGRRIGDVISANDQGNIRLRKITIDLVHVEQLVVRDVGFREENVHVAGHAAGNRMDAELDVHAAFGERIVKLADFVLRLGDGHAVAGDHDHAVCVRELDRGVGRAYGANDAGVLAARVPTAMLFVRNPTGVSHSPAEHADLADCEAGVRALAAVLEDLAGPT